MRPISATSERFTAKLLWQRAKRPGEGLAGGGERHGEVLLALGAVDYELAVEALDVPDVAGVEAHNAVPDAENYGLRRA